MDNELKKGAKGASPRDDNKGPQAKSDDKGAVAQAGDGAAKSVAALKEQAAQALDGVKDKARQVQDDAGETYRKASRYTRDRYEQASSWTSDRYDTAARGASQAHRRSLSEFERVRRNAEDLVTHNPVMIGVAGLAAGLLLGALLPRTQRENEAFGKLSDEFREQGKRYALDLVREGRERVVEAFDPDAQGSGAAEKPSSPA